ncbi:MAG: GNAT family N-acetyltransferase [Defluviitaleaceae bacterium]|nr:GNAT family N-acetyltransferase [Defluviitaleaceae bacterium]
MLINDREITIRSAEKEDIDKAADILGTSFYEDPFFVWAIETPSDRHKTVANYYRLYMNLGLDITHVAETPDKSIVGVSIWLPHDAKDSSIDEKVEHAVGEYASRFRIFGEKSHANEPPSAPYHQLLGFGVLPVAHGLGVGSALLKYHHNKLDKLGIPTYLEASTRYSAGGVYGRTGYQPIGEPIFLTEGVDLFPLWRPAPEQAQALHAHETDHDDIYSVVGSLIKFGRYDWRVLDIHDNTALIISDKVIELRKYHDRCESVTWSNCTIRQYLNEDFYDTFDNAEKSRIVETRIYNYNNPWFGTSGGDDTIDKIFLLCVDEVTKYFGDSRQLRGGNPNTNYFIDDNFNNTRKALDTVASPSRWWLRTPGNLPHFVASVTTDGRVAVSGDFVNRSDAFSVGIRPALWLKI